MGSLWCILYRGVHTVHRATWELQEAMIEWYLLYSRFFFLPSISTPAGSESQVWINICCVLEANLKALLVFEPGCGSITWMDSLNKKKSISWIWSQMTSRVFCTNLRLCATAILAGRIFCFQGFRRWHKALSEVCCPRWTLWQVVVVQEKRRYPGDVHLAWGRNHWDNLLQPVTLL